ncbi:MAG TPA: vanadium-dependent haloperoxidase [Actinomycetes bacterium]|nr:vanadium-dependent haloperoxidase [Actinomycetes bacterium]
MSSASRRRTATAWLLSLLSLATVVAAHAPVAASGRRAPAVRDNVVLLWDEAALQAVRDTRPAPTVTARALAVVHASIYDAWAAYDANAVGTRLGGALRRPPAERTPANKRMAISFAAYRALVNLFPARTASFDAVMAALGYDPAGTSRASSPAGVGGRAAAAVLAHRAGDGANQAGGYADTSGYRPVNTPDEVLDADRWQPLRLPGGAVQTWATPHWYQVTPFALRSAAQFRPDGPIAHVDERGRPNRAYVRQARQVLRDSRELDDRSKSIAAYWWDGPSTELPAGHWCLLAQYVSRRDHHSVDQDAKMFLALTGALLDAGIAAWDAKRAYDSVRPITAVRQLFRGRTVLAWGGPGRGTRAIPGEEWLPYQPPAVVTPPFAEYVSGHSTFSAAAAEVLASFTGGRRFGFSVTIPAGSSMIEPGVVPSRPVTLTFPTFDHAADQAGRSRRYGGIHFEAGDLDGRRLGRRVGASAWAKAQRYFDGTAVDPVG